MKILLGVVIGAGIMFGGYAFARETGIVLVSSITNSDGINSEQIRKYYDFDNGIVCYTNDGYRSGGISCLHN